MKAKFLALLAGVFAILVQWAVANAVPITTQPQIEPFTLDTNPTVTFSVITGEGNPPKVDTTNNGPVINSTQPLTLVFNKFDTSLGNLTGVSITFTTTYGATVTLNATNEEVVGQDAFFADGTIKHELTGSLISLQSSTQTLSATCSADINGDCTDSKSSNNNAFSNTLSFSGMQDVIPFEGPGTFELTATLTSALAPRARDAVDNSTGTLDANWNGNVSVVYTYDNGVAAVPEPLSICLLLGGLGGIAISRRRR